MVEKKLLVAVILLIAGLLGVGHLITTTTTSPE